MKQLFLAILLISPAAAQTEITAGAQITAGVTMGANPTAQCGAPSYACANTSLSTLSMPLTAPSGLLGLLGAGNTWVDPLSGVQETRLTDAHTNPNDIGAATATWSPSNGGNADDNWISVQGGLTRLTLAGNAGGWHHLLAFNTSTRAVANPYSSVSTPGSCPRSPCNTFGGFEFSGNSDYSSTDPCKLFFFTGTAVNYYEYGSDVTSWSNACSASISGPPSPTSVANFIEANPPGCVGAGCNCLPLNFGSPTWSGELGVVAGDTLFGGAFSSANYHFGNGGSGQGTGYYVVVWSPTKGCWSYNTSTGAMQADIGWSGAIGLTCAGMQCTGTAQLPGGAGASPTYTIHQGKLAPNGSVAEIQFTTQIGGPTLLADDPLTWVIGTNIVYQSETNHSSGHFCSGNQGLFNYPNSPLWQFDYRTQSSSGSGAATVVNTLPSPAPTISDDVHCSASMQNANDTGVFGWTPTTAPLASQGFGELPLDQPFTAWVGELDLSSNSGTGVTFREAYLYNSNQSVYFNSTEAICSFSRDGIWEICPSDGYQAIRNVAANATSCIGNGPVWLASKAYPANYIINPHSATNPGNFSYQTAASCTAGLTEPGTWNQTVAGTQSDGTCNWVNINEPSGANSCASEEIMIGPNK